MAAEPAAAAVPALSCAAPTATVTLATAPDAPPLRLELPPAGAAFAVLVGEETGVDLEWQWSGEAAFHDIDARPPRFGTFAVPLRGGEVLQLRLRANASRSQPARLALRLYCAPPAEIASLPVCLAAPLSPVSRVLAAPGSRCAAQGLHAEATRAARAGDNRAALDVYERAAAAWQARGDRLREGAARLGATEILVRLGRFDAALAMADRSAALSRAVGNEYFAARAGSERCLALRELGRRADASACQQNVAADYVRLDEAGDAANAYVSLASMAHEDGDSAAATGALALLDGLDAAR
ncbi:hypothetical protein, partial [Tahibacter caeni]|uniref:hypothetical protein n=1 Tax=Tahibacter caeni TaxID=1453545 RepID=UPI0021494F0C